MRRVRIQFFKDSDYGVRLPSGEVHATGKTWLQALGEALKHMFQGSCLTAQLNETDEDEAREEDEAAE